MLSKELMYVLAFYGSDKKKLITKINFVLEDRYIQQKYQQTVE